MYKYTLTFLFILIISGITAQNVVIPDITLKQALVNHLFPTIDTNEDGEIQISEALNTTGIHLSNPAQNDNDILDLTGLEAFTNLQGLSIYSYQIINYDVSIYNSLVNLDLGRCKVTSIDVSSNINLEHLSLDDNNLSSIDVSALVELETLDLRYNDNIETIDISNNIKLTKLSLDRNNLSQLDVTNNSLLTELTLPWNNLTTIDISNNLLLKKLSLTNNNISEINLISLTDLENINLTNNDLSNIDFSGNPNLEFIYLLGNNALTSIDISQNTKLEWLNLISTGLETIDVSDKPFLRNLNFWGNPNLTYVNMKNGNNSNFNLIGSDIKDLPKLEEICVDNISYAQENFVVDNVEFTYINDCNPEQKNTITGIINYHTGSNSCINNTPLTNILIEVSTDNRTYSTISDQNGVYEIDIPNTGDYVVTIIGGLDDNHTTPNNFNSSFTGFGNTNTVDFCIESQSNENLNINIIPLGEARPGFIAYHNIVYKNKGTSVANGIITLEFNQDIQDISLVYPNYDTIDNNKITWSFSNLQPYETRVIFANFRISPPPTVNGGDVLTYTAEITDDISDNNPNNNKYTLEQIVVNSFDPNDKKVIQGESIYIDEVSEYLDYIVRFQNTGTASAINVRIEDILDVKLDWNSFQMISASHDYEINITDGNKIEFIFNNINLPDSTSDERSSNGYVAFKVKPKADILLEDIIYGKADIYFDFNLPIETNIVSTQVIERPNLSVSKASNKSNDSIIVFPLPVIEDKLNVKVDSHIDIISSNFILISGETINCTTISKSKSEIIFDISNISSNIFFLRLETNNGLLIKKIIK